MPSRPPTHRAPRLPSATPPRPSAHRRGYGARWQALRAWFFAQPGNAVCATPGCHRPAVHVDHVVAREAGGTDDPANLQGLCASCHSRKTARQDRGFGRPRRHPGG